MTHVDTVQVRADSVKDSEVEYSHRPSLHRAGRRGRFALGSSVLGARHVAFVYEAVDQRIQAQIMGRLLFPKKKPSRSYDTKCGIY